MDSTEAVTHIGLCAGYGGIELGLKRVIPNLRSVALCEIEAFACANLVAKMEAGLMDPAPVWSDLKTFPWAEFRGRVDILTGGYPCQPFSAAGKRLGGEDPRHLWPHISGGIRLLQPALCFFENVEGHITQGLHYVLSDLGELGYRTTWGLFSAAEVGAPHQRKRVFILAHRNDAVLEGWHGTILRQCSCELPAGQSRASIWPSRPGEPQHAWEPPRIVGDSENRTRLSTTSGTTGHAPQPDQDVGDSTKLHRNGSNHHAGISERPKEISKPGDASWTSEYQQIIDSIWQAQPPLGGDTDGPPSRLDHAELCVSCDNRTDELRLLGNGVVPATAELAFRTLIQELLQ